MFLELMAHHAANLTPIWKALVLHREDFPLSSFDQRSSFVEQLADIKYDSDP